MSHELADTRISERRFRRYIVPEGALIHFAGGTVRVVWENVPADAVIVEHSVNTIDRCIDILVSSMEFDPVAEGDAIPSGGTLEVEAIEPETRKIKFREFF